MSEKPAPKEKRSGPGRRAGESVLGPGGPALVTCPHCGRTVPEGEFCGHCGAHLRTADVNRRHAFAALPSEPVMHFNVISTLFPHLPHRRGGPFRWALIAGGLLVVLLAALHLFAPATTAAAFLLPVLYLLYLYEVEVYAEEPWLLIAATMVAGAVLGYAFTELAGGAASRVDLAADSGGGFWLRAIGIPIVSQALMLAGPLFLFLIRDRYREPLDGLTFGAASALGFSLAAELAALWPLITGPLVATGDPVDWALRVLRLGVLVSLVNASTTGLVTASIWLHRYDRRRSERAREVSVPATLVVAFCAQLVLGALTFVLQDLIVQVFVWVLATIALMLYVRQVIHQALLAEGAVHEIGPDSQCPECHHIVPTMLFCPNCGAARAAAPRSTRTGSAS
jgi:RsiW-degrading membrane proteinase PrsW (M82 family)